jgi:hypothetical protein
LSHEKLSEDTAFVFTKKKKKSDFTQLQMLEEGPEIVMGWTVRSLNRSGGKIFCTHPD